MPDLTKALLKGVLESSRPHFPREDVHYFHTLEHAVETAIAHLASAPGSDEDDAIFRNDVDAAIAAWSAGNPGRSVPAGAADSIAASRDKVLQIVREAYNTATEEDATAINALLLHLSEADARRRARRAERVAAFLAEPYDVADTEIDPEQAERVMRRLFPDHPQLTIEGLKVLNGLHSREVHFLNVVEGDWRRPLVIRRDRRENLTPGSVADEYAIMKALYDAGLPIPEPVGSSKDPEDLARPFVAMDRVAARTLNIAGDPAADQRMLEIADLLAKYHAVPVEAAGFASEGTAEQLERHYKEHAIPYWEDALRAISGFESFTMEWALHYLRAAFPADAGGKLHLIHGDYRTRQILSDSEGLVALLDFELAGPGSPAEDLACIRPETEARMPWQEFLDRYEAAGGIPIPAETLTYFDIFIQFRDIIVVARGEDIFERGQVADLHFGVMGVTWIPMLLDQLQRSLEAVNAAPGAATRPKGAVTII